MENLDELVCKAHFRGRPYFAYLGSKTIEDLFEQKNDIFGVQFFENIYHLIYVVLHLDTFPTLQESPQLETI